MEHAFFNLVDLLEGQQGIYEDLLSISRLKQSELVKGSLEALDSLTRQEEVLIFQVGRLEEERLRCTNELRAYCKLEEGSPLSQLIEAAPAEAKEKLLQLQKSLKDTFGQMKKVNEENMALLKQSLRLVQISLEALSGETPTTYTPEREIKVATLNRLLDKKI